MVHDHAPGGLDRVEVSFDDERVVSDAGIALVATLVERHAIEQLAQRWVRLRRDRPGASNAGRKGGRAPLRDALGRRLDRRLRCAGGRPHVDFPRFRGHRL